MYEDYCYSIPLSFYYSSSPSSTRMGGYTLSVVCDSNKSKFKRWAILLSPY
jgi:hypothetical protein